MTTVFADAGYWIAIINPLEMLHLKAKKLAQTYVNAKLITTELVLVELLNFYAAGGSRMRSLAVRYVAQIRQNSSVEVIGLESALFDKGHQLYANRPDKEWGMVDCVSFVVMQERGLTDALAYDHHFQQAGFRALMREA
jgi:predicted nucleic acid-binding protein